ncbi:hypothetical protein LX32DRAFT_441706 [Colletotrichum zoysiae]|uniref:Uncharacterized protein n=1 Tax=Colletotrichum zoysiae TaxID=1216348 RepID=A0AAD9HS08_9PEZI|nr:hypothetical protein LX32DRAFT_441706 [Colletotrichum zoysiae]
MQGSRSVEGGGKLGIPCGPGTLVLNVYCHWHSARVHAHDSRSFAIAQDMVGSAQMMTNERKTPGQAKLPRFSFPPRLIGGWTDGQMSICTAPETTLILDDRPQLEFQHRCGSAQTWSRRMEWRLIVKCVALIRCRRCVGPGSRRPRTLPRCIVDVCVLLRRS